MSRSALKKHAVEAAKASLQQTLTANSAGAEGLQLPQEACDQYRIAFGWLLGQVKALHYQAYDAVVSLCLNAQASLNAETGDYDTSLPSTQGLAG